jgi:hypothetical protein
MFMSEILADRPLLARHSAPFRARHDSAFFGGMAILLAIVVFAGFAPTFYLRPPLRVLPTLSPLLIVHAVLFSAWMLFYPVQVILVATGAARWHRQLGIAGAVLAASMVLMGTAAQVEHTRAVIGDGSYASNALVEDLGLSLSMLDIAVFAAFVSAAIWLRHRPDQHKRLMLFATLAIIGPAMVRFSAITSLPPIAVVMSPLIFVIPLMAYDVLTRGRLLPVTVWGVSISVAYHVLAMVMVASGVAGSVARWVSA